MSAWAISPNGPITFPYPRHLQPFALVWTFVRGGLIIFSTPEAPDVPEPADQAVDRLRPEEESRYGNPLIVG